MIRLFRTAYITVILISLFISPPNASSAEDNPEKIIAVALSNWPPQYLTGKKTGKPAGFAIDIMGKVAELSGLNVHYVVYNYWPDVLKALENNQAVLAPNMGIALNKLPNKLV